MGQVLLSSTLTIQEAYVANNLTLLFAIANKMISLLTVLNGPLLQTEEKCLCLEDCSCVYLP